MFCKLFVDLHGFLIEFLQKQPNFISIGDRCINSTFEYEFECDWFILKHSHIPPFYKRVYTLMQPSYCKCFLFLIFHLNFVGCHIMLKVEKDLFCFHFLHQKNFHLSHVNKDV